MIPSNRRTVARDIVYLKAKYFEGTVEVTVIVHNISNEGVLIHGEKCGPAGTSVLLKLAHIGQVGGTVAWTEGAYCGIRFLAPIDYRLVRARTGGGFGIARPIDVSMPKRAV